MMYDYKQAIKLIQENVDDKRLIVRMRKNDVKVYNDIKLIGTIIKDSTRENGYLSVTYKLSNGKIYRTYWNARYREYVYQLMSVVDMKQSKIPCFF